MSVESVSSQSPATARSSGRSQSFHQFLEGQQLRVNVFERAGAHHYVVGINGERHLVMSAMTLNVGSEVLAVVEATGDRLELRYVGEQATKPLLAESVLPPLSGMTADEMLPVLSDFYRVPLSHADDQLLRNLADSARDPARMLMSGLFLARMQTELNPGILGALYQLQVSSGTQPASAGRSPSDPARLSAATADHSEIDELSMSLLDALTPQDVGGIRSVADSEGDDEHPATIAQRLLNRPEEGSIQHQYGHLPLLVAGELVELDLAMFTPKSADAAKTSNRRLVMSFSTETFGAIQIEAKAIDQRLVVTLTGESAAAIDTLAAHENEVRRAAERLGWAVEVISYDVTPQVARAARDVVDHVLSTGTVNRLL